MKQTVFRGLFFIFAGCLLAGCERKVSGPTAAQVGSYKISVDDLKSRLEETPAAYQLYAASEEGRRQFLGLLIREKLLLAEATERRISKDPAYRQSVKKFKEDSKRRLKDYQETLLVESALRRLRTTELAVTDSDVAKYYEIHRDDFDHPVEVMAAHILLSSEGDAKGALARLKAKEPFERVAKEMSKDPATAVRGGRLGPFQRGKLVSEFEAAAFALKVGQTSGIVKTQFGFHIIKKISEKKLPPRSAAEVKDEIRARLEREKFDLWIKAKEEKLGVKVNEDAIARLTPEEPTKQ